MQYQKNKLNFIILNLKIIFGHKFLQKSDTLFNWPQLQIYHSRQTASDKTGDDIKDKELFEIKFSLRIARTSRVRVPRVAC